MMPFYSHMGPVKMAFYEVAWPWDIYMEYISTMTLCCFLRSKDTVKNWMIDTVVFILSEVMVCGCSAVIHCLLSLLCLTIRSSYSLTNHNFKLFLSGNVVVLTYLKYLYVSICVLPRCRLFIVSGLPLFKAALSNKLRTWCRSWDRNDGNTLYYWNRRLAKNDSL